MFRILFFWTHYFEVHGVKSSSVVKKTRRERKTTRMIPTEMFPVPPSLSASNFAQLHEFAEIAITAEKRFGIITASFIVSSQVLIFTDLPFFVPKQRRIAFQFPFSDGDAQKPTTPEANFGATPAVFVKFLTRIFCQKSIATTNWSFCAVVVLSEAKSRLADIESFC